MKLKTQSVPRALSTLWIAGALLAGAQFSEATPFGTDFTYQGHLDGAAGPATGLYDFTFALHLAASGGTPMVTVTNANVTVSNGLFTTAIDFGAGIFTGNAYWLELSVRTNGSGAFSTLSPRQPLTPTPYAHYAALAGNLNGTLADGRLSPNVALRGGGNAFTGNQTIADNVSVGGSQDFGAQTRQMLNLWGTQYALGVQASSLYFRCDNSAGTDGFIWYKGGVHSDGYANPGGGTEMMHLVSSGLYVNSTVFGTSATGNGVQGSSGNAGSGVYGENIGQGFGVAGRSSGSGVAVYGDNISPTGWAGDFNGNVRVIGTNTTRGIVTASSDVTEAFEVSGAAAGYALLDRTTGAAGRWSMYALNGTLGFFNAGADRMTLTSAGLTVNGTTTTRVLTITGGADIAEPFKMSGRDLPKGAVVVIDEANPGHLKLSDSPYDTRVAGIISGANGVNPGISLSQQGAMEGDQNVALSGRVYVQADDSGGPINAGDLLTTSATSGHAMKVADHGKAQGAILGKAMTALKDGKGMVLVLVTLQ